MRRLGQVLCLLLVALWLPTTLHCKLEVLPGFEFLACDGEFGEDASHCGDECCSLERTAYKSEQTRLNLSCPVAVQIPTLLLTAANNDLPAQVGQKILSAAPPELLQTWHLVSRPALPVRAPSVAS